MLVLVFTSFARLSQIDPGYKHVRFYVLHCINMQLFLIFIISLLIVSPASAKQMTKTSMETYPPYACYECTGSECNNPYQKTCDNGLKCFTHTEVVDGMYLYREKGCHRVPFVSLTSCHRGMARKRQNETNPVHTCCRGNFCNDDDFDIPNFSEPTIISVVPKFKDEWINGTNLKGVILTEGNFEEIVSAKGMNLLYVAFLLLLIVTLTSFIMALVYFVFNRRKAAVRNNLDVLHETNNSNTYDANWTSGSGSGLAYLNQRSLSQDVSLIDCIGHGRYGEVWHGKMLGEDIAVKIFSTIDGASWENEVNIFTNIALYHENVLGFKGSAIASRHGVTEMWLLTAYHELGSLYDCLLENTISHEQMLVFVRSACSGLLHLHTEIFGSKGKPPIAHRDIKTRNILITSYGTCVIADFGLAVVKSNGAWSPNYLENYKVGTKRYMAPELLDDGINTNSFESFKRADMYAFGLLIWEICSRCVAVGIEETFRLAFYDSVPNNPDFEDMKKVVCIELKRPEIPDKWLSDEPLKSMAEIMKHCWHKNPEVRFTAHRVKKNLNKIYSNI